MSAETPVGRSIATTGTPSAVDVGDDRLEQPAQLAAEAGAENRVDDQSHSRDLA